MRTLVLPFAPCCRDVRRLCRHIGHAAGRGMLTRHDRVIGGPGQLRPERLAERCGGDQPQHQRPARRVVGTADHRPDRPGISGSRRRLRRIVLSAGRSCGGTQRDGTAAMKPFLALLAFLTQAGLQVERVSIPTPDGTALDAALVQPVGPTHGPAVVALHGCGGPFASRDGSWAVVLAHAGHLVLLPDSFGSRGLGSQCSVRMSGVTPSWARRHDAIAAATWLTQRPGTPAGGVELVGWSHGGSTVLFTAQEKPDLPPGLFRRFVAFYPGCASIPRSHVAAGRSPVAADRRERRLDTGCALPRPGGAVPRPHRVRRLSRRLP